MQNNFYFKGNFSNIYKKPSKFSEVTSQIIYGEGFNILSKNKGWIKIKSSFLNINNKQLEYLTYGNFSDNSPVLILLISNIIYYWNKIVTKTISYYNLYINMMAEY